MNTKNLDILNSEYKDAEDEHDEEKLSLGTFDEGYIDPWRYDSRSPPSMVPIRLLPTLVQRANSEADKDVFQGVMLIRKLLAVERDPPTQQVVDSGVAPRLAQCMQHSDHELQFEASWALCNIAAGETEHAEYIIRLQVVPLWVSHLSHPSPKCVEQATWAIGNIAGVGDKCRDHALEMGAMPPLLSVIEHCSHEQLRLLQSAVWALSNLCRFEPQPANAHIAPAVPLLVRLSQHPDLEVAMDALWALFYISSGPLERVNLVIDSGGASSIVKLLNAKNRKYHMPVIRILGRICACAANQATAGEASERIFSLMIECGVVDAIYFAELTSSANKMVAKASSEVVLTITESAYFPIIDGAGFSPLHVAAYYGHVAAMVALMDKGAALDAIDENGETPLHIAAQNGHVRAVETLVAEGADVGAVNNYHQTPITLFKGLGLSEDEVTRVKQLLNPSSLNRLRSPNS